ncbi:MAG TPA: outer membrane beta-barrel protein [Terriglobia bacterium]|nr:outer membrane beta-barrel protein [Terriglobia bacterium]
MRKFLWLIPLVLFHSAPATAQGAAPGKAPQIEVFGGYSYALADFSNDRVNLSGWNFSLTENVNSWFGGTADFSGHYAQPSNTNVNAHMFLFGPTFALRRSKSVTPFSHVLLGGIHASRGYVGVSEPVTRFAAAFGGGVDLKIHEKVAIRVFQADYFLTPFFGLRQDNLRLSAGIVFQFGKK